MIEFFDKFWKEVRCVKCRTLLAYEFIFNGRLLIKCYRCNEMNGINYKTRKSVEKQYMADPKYNPEGEFVLKRIHNPMKGGVKK